MAGVLAREQPAPESTDISGYVHSTKPKALISCGSKCEVAADTLKVLPGKLVKLMSALSNVPKDKFNQGEGYKYLSSDALLDRINPACVKLGLATVVDTELLDGERRPPSQA